jgi:KipI family sensor histidine kinase inhibitor
VTYRVLDAGDAAITVEFGDAIDPRLLAAVNALDAAIARLQAEAALPGLIETMPTFRSLTLFFDPLVTGRAALLEALRPLLAGADDAPPPPGRRWCLPVCYAGEAAPDLAEVARTLGLSEAEVVALHSGTDYLVYMLGFLPGFPFMGDLPAALRLPRRAEPRLRVPPGSVAIATGLTAIYPWESPGGWHLLGRCPVPLFDAARAAPSLLAAGDRVRFRPIDAAEYGRLERAVRAGEIDPAQWLAAEAVPEAVPEAAPETVAAADVPPGAPARPVEGDASALQQTRSDRRAVQ